ncbi:hypothetical protein [Dysgonomonas sp. ZJ709]|uniref:hypothetical protein n=1 Tax=Dysgonomonas sp. ZJ709 TaxID=2709797 RepID=UPI0013EC411F|nr:hypothetical protein [Dysgonomonas sp. ZJ709]
MNINYLTKLLTNILFFHAIGLSAQVTIGSAIAPVEGALLELKQDGETTKGLGLPRVYLIAPDNLAPCVIDASPTTKDAHTGLVVYNQTEDNGLSKGIYVWDGAIWERLLFTESSTNPVTTPSDANSNAFILPLGKSLEIPVTKAYDMWEKYSMLGNQTLTGQVTAEVYWSDVSGLVDISLPNGDNGRTSVIRITHNKTNDQLGGNAVVAVRVGGIVRWSWHIWVTGYDPDNEGRVYTYSNGTDTNIFMDRNLGALSNNPADGFLTLGNTYEWGRKDPFPRPSGLDNPSTSTSAPETILYGVKTDITRTTTNENPDENLQNSITDPLQYIGYNSWFIGNNYLYNNEDADFWGQMSQSKGDFDPCPAGWRIPFVSADGRSPWEGLQESDVTLVVVEGKAGSAFDFSDKLGLYPLSGGRSNDANLVGRQFDGTVPIGEKGFYWTASHSYKDASCYFGIVNHGTYLQIINTGIDVNRKALGSSVRCVKA